MKTVIQIANCDKARSWALLQRLSPGVALPERVYVVSDEVLEALRLAGIQWRVISNDAGTLAADNAGVVDWLLACPEKGWFSPISSESTNTL